MNRKYLSYACACLMLASIDARAAEPAKTQFQRPLHIIVPFAPGGGQDTTARLLAPGITEIIGQQVIVDNRPGAAGIIAAETLLKAPADGHTVYLASTSFVVAPSLRKSLPFDTLKDFAPITRVSNSPGTLVVHASLPVRTVRDLVRLAKRKPGQITFGSAGVASNSHLSGELFKVLAGVDIIHVPYKGSALASNALVSGEIVMGFSNALATMPHVKAGRLKVLGVTTAKRSPLLPEVPTIAEAGVPGFENMIWSGVVASSATPKAALSALHDAFSRVIQALEFRERLARGGAEPFVGDTPAEYGAFIRAEIEKWGKVVRQAGIKAQ
ncbi:MAG: tripartite tricarboxylate transporter substrate binding protein [Betaproteobacteria bacterium]|nr:tripartite tricarboxylate transporter substrate binding protein [Betaproteobacteria bacterium]